MFCPRIAQPCQHREICGQINQPLQGAIARIPGSAATAQRRLREEIGMQAENLGVDLSITFESEDCLICPDPVMHGPLAEQHGEAEALKGLTGLMAAAVEHAGVSCENCVAACCRGGTATFMLTTAERSKHRGAMTLEVKLREKPYPQVIEVKSKTVPDGTGGFRSQADTLRVPAHRGLFVLKHDCGYLASPAGTTAENKVCTNYDRRPEACRAIKEGSTDCLAARAMFGLDQP